MAPKVIEHTPLFATKPSTIFYSWRMLWILLALNSINALDTSMPTSIVFYGCYTFVSSTVDLQVFTATTPLHNCCVISIYTSRWSSCTWKPSWLNPTSKYETMILPFVGCVLYSFHDMAMHCTLHWGGHRGGSIPPCQGVWRGVVAPLHRVQGSAQGKKWFMRTQ